MFKRKQYMIYKDVLEIMRNTLSRYKGVNYVKYQSKILNNAQNNNKTIQCYIYDVAYHQFNLTTNIVKAEYNIYILSTPTKDNESILDIQDECYNIAINFLAYLDTRDEWKGLISVHDYSIITVAHYTDNDSAGVRLSVTLSIPNGVDLCTYENNFNDEPYTPEEDTNIDIPEKEQPDMELKKVKLPKKKKDKC
jgi:hypothetical protein